MSFLYPNVLWFLLALAIPILVHLFNFRKPKRLLFSNLAFVKEVNQVVQRRMKLKQYLLLAARLLLFAALIFLFAGPYLRSDDGKVTSGGRSVVIVIDNSLSMNALDDQGPYLAQARKLAYTLIQTHGPNAQYQIQTTGNLLLSAPFVQQGQAFLQLDELAFQDKTVSFAQILNNAELYFSEASNPVHSLYFLSDFQQSTVMADTSKIRPLSPDINVHFVPIGNRPQKNLYVSNLSFEDAIIEKDKPVTLNLTIQNDGEEEVTDLGLNVMLDGKAVGVSTVSAGAGQSATVQLNFTPQSRGWQSGYVSLEDLPIEFDNKRHFSFYIPENSKALLVTSNEDAHYLKLFFSKLMSQYRLDVVDQGRFSNVNMEDYTTVIMAGVEDVSGGLGARLQEWVEEGGGILVFPGARMQPGINRFLTNMKVGSFTKLYTYDKAVALQQPDLQDQLFDGVFSKGKKDAEFDSPLFNKVYDFKPGPGSLHNVVLRDKNGRNVLVKTQVEAGWVFTFGSFPNLNWSDFPIKSSFVPIVYRSTLLINNAARSEFSQTLGKFTLRKLKAPGEGRISLKDEKGDKIVPEQYDQSGKTILKFDRTGVRPGSYNIVQGDSTLEKISFNLNSDESRLKAAGKSELETSLSKLGFEEVKVLQGNEAVLRKEVSMSTGGVPLWKYFLIISVLMVIAEALIIRFVK